jgi:hypothetical protein
MARKPTIKTAKLVADWLWPTFVEVEGLVFLLSEAPKDVHGIPADWDRTQIESFFNHIHILDWFSHKAGLESEAFWDSNHPDFLLACEVGRYFAQTIAAKLRIDFPKRHFRVYFTSRDNPIVRFHQIQRGERGWLEYSDNPVGFDSGEIVAFDTRSKPNHRMRSDAAAMRHRR